MTQKLLTVTVPCYNSASFMRRCLDSLLPGGERIEVIIINDGSTDDTGAVAEEYQRRYPHIFRAVHQENGGHGEGINQGLRLAAGTYFKVVDSDDWLSADLPAVLDKLESLEAEGGVDMLVTNYVYTHDDPTLDHTINYRRPFRRGRACCWNDTRSFGPQTYLTLHSVTYRTALVRQSGVQLPKHMSYEDNLFVYAPLPLTARLCYMDVDLYHYFIGREGQSVQGEVFAARYAQQVRATMLIFFSHDLQKELMRNRKRGRYMLHECRMLLALATAGARLNGSEAAESAWRDMWQRCIEHEPRYARTLMRQPPICWQTIRGRNGRRLSNFLYAATRRLVKN